MSLYYTIIFFFFNDTATTEIYTVMNTLSLHDALPISGGPSDGVRQGSAAAAGGKARRRGRSEEHTSELQSLITHLVCRLLLEKKKTTDERKPNGKTAQSVWRLSSSKRN